MDYITKPLSRKKIREIAVAIRKIFDAPENEPFPVLIALEKITYIYPDCNFEVVEDNELPDNVPALCEFQSNNGFLIKIQKSIYNGAYERNIGGYRAHILHEICHIILFKIGYRPITERGFGYREIPAYQSVEW